jgi:hypothetical protein
MSGVEPNDDAVKLIADRMMRIPDVLPPEGCAYHIIEARTAAGESAGALLMPGAEGASQSSRAQRPRLWHLSSPPTSRAWVRRGRSELGGACAACR